MVRELDDHGKWPAGCAILAPFQTQTEPESPVSRKTPDQTPQHTSLARAMAVPIALFVGLIIVALVVGIMQAGGGAGVSGPAARDGKTLSAETMQRFRKKWDEVGVAIGSPDAPVTVREFADYQCPACAAFEPIAERIRETYVESGKVRFVFFDFPLQMHDNAWEAAAAARCAGRQGAYWAYHEHLYENQQEWAGLADPMSAFLNYAVEVGINPEKLRRCLVQNATHQIIARSVEIAKKIGVRATPTILVGPHVYSGVTSYETLSKAIEEQLAAAKP